MLRYHMAVISPDKALRRSIKRLTTATGATADFGGDESVISDARKVDLVIYDARQEDPTPKLLSKFPEDSRVLYIIEGDSLIQKLHLLKDKRSTSLFCHDERFDDDEFVATATKALRGEVFGLQKYFPWGVTTFSMVVKNSSEKGKAVDILDQYAELAGCRGGVRDRIKLVCDELMMNALYHAPVDEKGNEKYAGRTLKDLAQMEVVNPIEVRYGCSGRYFIVSVRDGQGSLARPRALEYLLKAQRAEQVIEQKASGAGLGLMTVLKSVSKLVFNLEKGHSTEVVAIFDMELFARGKAGARSVHLFEAPPRPAEQEEPEAAPEVPEQTGQIIRRPSKMPWLVAALLLAMVAAMGTAVYFQRVSPATAAVPRTVVVYPSPADAKVFLNGQEIEARTPVPMPDGTDRPVVKVVSPNHEAQTIQLESPGAVYVNLTPR